MCVYVTVCDSVCVMYVCDCVMYVGDCMWKCVCVLCVKVCVWLCDVCGWWYVKVSVWLCMKGSVCVIYVYDYESVWKCVCVKVCLCVTVYESVCVVWCMCVNVCESVWKCGCVTLEWFPHSLGYSSVLTFMKPLNFLIKSTINFYCLQRVYNSKPFILLYLKKNNKSLELLWSTISLCSIATEKKGNWKRPWNWNSFWKC